MTRGVGGALALAALVWLAAPARAAVNQSRAPEAAAAEGERGDGDGDEAPAAPVDPKSAGDEAAKLLAEPAYRFCHDPKFPLRPDEELWCDLDTQKRCPALTEACRQRHPEDKPDPNRETWGAALLGMLATVLLWATIIGVGLVLAFLLVRLIVRGAAGLASATAAETPGEARAEPVLVAASTAEPERDVAILLAAARAAADAGDFGRAIDRAYAALLRYLEAAALVQVRRDRTNGDYVRALRARPELQGVLREVVLAVERVQFGGAPPSADRYQTLLASVTAVVSRPLTLLVLLAMLLLGASGCGKRGKEADTPMGRSAVKRLLKAHDVELRHRVAPLERIGTETRALLVTRALDDDEWAKLEGWVGEGGSAMVVIEGEPPKASHLERKTTRGKKPLATYGEGRALFGKLHPQLPGVGCLAVGGDEKLVGDESDCAWLLRRGHRKGTWLFMANELLFTNAALAVGDNAAFVIDVARLTGSDTIEIVDDITGVSASSPLSSLFAGGLGPLLAQLSLVALLVLGHFGIAFGLRRDPLPPSRRRYADHVSALGEQYWKARAHRHALAAWGGWAIERLRERVHQRGGDAASLARAAAARSGEPAEEIAALLAEVQSAQAKPDGAPQGQELQTMTKLSRLLHKLGGAR